MIKRYWTAALHPIKIRNLGNFAFSQLGVDPVSLACSNFGISETESPTGKVEIVEADLFTRKIAPEDYTSFILFHICHPNDKVFVCKFFTFLDVYIQ